MCTKLCWLPPKDLQRYFTGKPIYVLPPKFDDWTSAGFSMANRYWHNCYKNILDHCENSMMVHLRKYVAGPLLAFQWPTDIGRIATKIYWTVAGFCIANQYWHNYKKLLQDHWENAIMVHLRKSVGGPLMASQWPADIGIITTNSYRTTGRKSWLDLCWLFNG